MLKLTYSCTESLVVGKAVTRPILMHHTSIEVVHEHGKPTVSDRGCNHEKDALHLERVVVTLVELVVVVQATRVLISETTLCVGINLDTLCQVFCPVGQLLLLSLWRLCIHATNARQAQQHSQNRSNFDSHSLVLYSFSVKILGKVTLSLSFCQKKCNKMFNFVSKTKKDD